MPGAAATTTGSLDSRVQRARWCRGPESADDRVPEPSLSPGPARAGMPVHDRASAAGWAGIPDEIAAAACLLGQDAGFITGGDLLRNLGPRPAENVPPALIPDPA